MHGILIAGSDELEDGGQVVQTVLKRIPGPAAALLVQPWQPAADHSRVKSLSTATPSRSVFSTTQ